MKNTEYKCPYCGTDSYSESTVKRRKLINNKFESWKSVRGHAKNCKDRDQEFIYCEYYGPIALTVINTYCSIENFREDYPQIKFESSFWAGLRRRTDLFIKQRVWNKEAIIFSIQEFFKLYNRIPNHKDFLHNLKYPSASTVGLYFGSWNKAIEAAGFEPLLSSGFGILTKSKDGCFYRSQAEAYFVDNFLFEKYQYEYEKPYGNGWYYDFYLPELDLYIEIDGQLPYDSYNNRIIEKINLNKELKRNCIFIKRKDLYALDFTLINIINKT